MLKWISKYGEREKKLIFPLNKRSLFVLYNATTHKTTKVKEKLKECEISLPMIPNGLTSKLFPFGISIIKFLKRKFKK